MRPSADWRAASGFTLLEIMVTVAIFGICLLPILHVREEATNRAYRTEHMLQGLHIAQELIAEHGREIEQMKQVESRFEDDPAFRYVVTFEDWDLATGRAEDELDEEETLDDPNGPLAPADAAVPPEDVRGDPHKVRRFRIEVFWPDIETADDEESLLLEGFIPRMWEEQLDDEQINLRVQESNR